MSNIEPIMIRTATKTDAPALQGLAERDSASVPRGPVLVAEAAGAIRAAISLADERTIADPFHPTADLVALLRARARHTRRVRRVPERIVMRTPARLADAAAG